MTTMTVAVGAPPAGGRRGMTLLEIIVSMTIFLLALGAIVPLTQMGLDRSLDIKLQAVALQKCQSKIAEMMSGSEPIQSQNDVPFPDNNDNEDWHWTSVITPGEIDNVMTVRITVTWNTDSRKTEVSLSQLILDPTVRGAPPAVPAATTTGGTTTGSTTGG